MGLVFYSYMLPTRRSVLYDRRQTKGVEAKSKSIRENTLKILDAQISSGFINLRLVCGVRLPPANPFPTMSLDKPSDVPIIYPQRLWPPGFQARSRLLLSRLSFPE